MTNIFDKFEKEFNEAKNITEGLDKAFNILPSSSFRLEKIIDNIRQKKARELEYCGIVESDFNYYYNLDFDEAKKGLSILVKHLNYFTEEFAAKNKQLEQERIMAIHAIEGKFGDCAEINLSEVKDV
jgi:predicted  nucleic acid-binding Zn-ribbon protein